MKVNLQTDRLLQVKHSKWLPWYWQILFWPTVLLLLLMTVAGEEYQLTCRKSAGTCQLISSSSKDQKTIQLDNIQKIDLVATDNADTDSWARMVIVGKDGSTINVGGADSFSNWDKTASKLSWFLESSTAQFIEISDSNLWLTRFLGLTGGLGLFWFFWRGGDRIVTFDRDQQLCKIESRQLFRNKSQDYALQSIQGVGLFNSIKPVGQNITLQRQAGNVAINEKVLPLSKQRQSEQIATQIRDFLNLKAPVSPVQAPNPETIDDEDGYEDGPDEA